VVKIISQPSTTSDYVQDIRSKLRSQ